MELIFTALGFGLLTSFHCIGMCGPIALALPIKQDSLVNRIFAAMSYNVGRTITYISLGLIFGILGTGFSLAGFQNWISILAGVFMIITIAFPKINRALFKGSGDTRLMKFVRTNIGIYFQKSSYKSLFIIGILNGLLPCGMVYMALAGALAVGSMGGSMLFMTLFGLGTIPVMLLISMIGNFATLKLKRIINKAIPFIVIVIGILFILRGLELGIKYISPLPKMMELDEGTMHHCDSVGDGEMKCM